MRTKPGIYPPDVSDADFDRDMEEGEPSAPTAPDQKAREGDDLVSIGALMDELYWYHKKIQGASDSGKPWADLFKEEWTELNDALSKRTRPGRRMVPVEPTHKQLEAGYFADSGDSHAIGKIYKAMLAAAPAEREGE